MGVRFGSGSGIFKGAGSISGSALTIYNSDNSLIGDRLIELDGNSLSVQDTVLGFNLFNLRTKGSFSSGEVTEGYSEQNKKNVLIGDSNGSIPSFISNGYFINKVVASNVITVEF